MIEKITLQPEVTVTCNGITNEISALATSMDEVGEDLDGFSDSESGDSETDTEKGNKSTRDVTRRRYYPPTKLLRRCVLERQSSLILPRQQQKKPPPKSRVKSARAPKTDYKREYRDIGKHNHSHHKKSADENNVKVTENDISLDSDEFLPLIAGQCQNDVNVPIMTSPEVETEEEAKGSRIRIPTSLTWRLLSAGEKYICNFTSEESKNSIETLKSFSEKTENTPCICVASQRNDDDVICGWVTQQSAQKTKSGKRRRSSMKPISSEVAFNRLTGALPFGKSDPLGYQHYKDTSKYIERYRYFHTVGRICRPLTAAKPGFGKKANLETDPYLKRMKTLCAMASTCDIYNLLASQPSREQISSASSSENAADKCNKSEDESVEDYSFDKCMRDRGKALNLAPVREFTAPDMSQEQLEHFQQNYAALNQYLNLITPPIPINFLQLDIDESKCKQYGNRTTNTGDNNLFPACTPRRGARPLRLGSAEFVKPGAKDSDSRWHGRRASKPSTPTGSTVPGTLIVGSTVMQPNSVSHCARVKSGGKNTSAYVHYQRERLQNSERNISGVYTQPSSRRYLSPDVTLSSKERNTRLTYTHATSAVSHANHAVQAPCRTATAVDLQEPLPRREKITLGVNHLGIRGHTLRQGDQINLTYKTDRIATLKS